ncbi:tetratricopeptide repeat protein [Paludisphaera rhizosphaerae]|uniref:tetratricopeptide repeat protein n=1 Tax=Paludisphaera rhizosphaerae TaxID=2711216 RepID=UPI0013ED7B8B|nr:tetratricopeptide repeat protein [Paludisphaera rhizosphaerae]
MAAVDPYAPCPCGSGEKFKWCCQKAESYIDRALRLERNGQSEAALAALTEGLAKNPGNPLLSLRRAMLLSTLGRGAEALETVDGMLKTSPNHRGALAVKFRLLQANGDQRGAVDLLQTLIEQSADRGEPAPDDLATSLGATLFRAGFIPSALRHLTLADPEHAAAQRPDRVEAVRRELLNSFQSAPTISPWLKNPYKPLSCPEGVGDDARRRFEEALGWYNQAMWRRAADAFELLSGDPKAGRAAEVNQGLCRLLLTDHAGAAATIRRGIAGSPATTEAVDLEALCQLIDPTIGDDPVESVELSWPVRDRGGLLKRLRESVKCVERVEADAEPGDDVEFSLLDRPRLADDARPNAADVPMILGSVFVEAETLTLQTFDDGRLNDLIDVLTAIAGTTIPPAHPRTKVLGPVSRQALALENVFEPPAALPIPELRKLTAELSATRIQDRWVETPLAPLKGKTPIEAGRDGGYEIPLRASLTVLEAQAPTSEGVDWPALRARLGVPQEPAIDPIDVVLEDVHIGRLVKVDPHGLDDERLVKLREIAHEWGLVDVVTAASREIASRRRLLEREGFPTIGVFTDLAVEEAVRGNREAALGWIAKGRDSEPQARRPVTAPAWDMLGIRVRMMLEGPEEWAPEVAAVMGRYESNAQAMQTILAQFIDLGLVELVPSPEDPGRYVADPTILYNILMRYGPRVQAVGGAPAGGGLWTPGSGAPAGGSSGVWTPGSSSSAPAEKPRIIIPGR